MDNHIIEELLNNTASLWIPFQQNNSLPMYKLLFMTWMKTRDQSCEKSGFHSLKYYFISQTVNGDSDRKHFVILSAMWHYCGGVYSSHVGNWLTDQVRIPLQFNLGDQWVLLGLFIDIWMRGYLQEQKWPPPKPTPARVTDHESWEPGAHCLACRDLNMLGTVSQTVSVCFQT